MVSTVIKKGSGAVRMNRKKHESGAIAIEAAISLSIFMLAISGIMLFSMIVRTQSLVNYALNQTAKEISGYFYLVDKIGLTEMLSGVNNNDTKAGIQKMNDAINSLVAFSSDASDGISDMSQHVQGVIGEEMPAFNISGDTFSLSEESFDQFMQEAQDVEAYIQTQQGNIQGAIDAGNATLDKWRADINSIKESFTKLGDNPMDTFKAVLLVFSRSLVNRAFSQLVTPVICEWLVPKYLTDGKMEDFCNKASIIPESVSFSESKMLSDGRSIRLVMEYQMDLSRWTLGFGGDMPVTMRSVACTAAWIRPDSSLGTLRTLSQVAELNSTKKYFDPDYELPETEPYTTTATTATTETTETTKETTTTTKDTTTTTTDTTTTTTTTTVTVMIKPKDAVNKEELKKLLVTGSGDRMLTGCNNKKAFFKNLLDAHGRLAVDADWFYSLTQEETKAYFDGLEEALNEYNQTQRDYNGVERDWSDCFQIKDNGPIYHSLSGSNEIEKFSYTLPKEQGHGSSLYQKDQNGNIRYSDNVIEKVTYDVDPEDMVNIACSVFGGVQEDSDAEFGLEIIPEESTAGKTKFKGYDENGILWEGYLDGNNHVTFMEPCFEKK